MTLSARMVSVVVVLVIVGIGSLLWRQKVTETTTPTTLQTAEAFIPPVYGSDGTEVFITLPLFLEKRTDKNTLSAEQRQRVSEFKKHILARATSRIPLKESEKAIIFGSISTDASATGDSVVVNQALLQFTETELGVISQALQK
jgi:hypothetical protein